MVSYLGSERRGPRKFDDIVSFILTLAAVYIFLRQSIIALKFMGGTRLPLAHFEWIPPTQAVGGFQVTAFREVIFV
ncbi:hypothetical protein F5050DRAFT_1905631 [Lentinula boryana]|uniref:Uncharacterized protein n=1 Tax=Lentinula boryana TaxID=40481 RepID=A0ABQ8PZW2_9AGAR|nr:hypothetical protein F5050DRAFT_1905631 [Lentinula boryana]